MATKQARTWSPDGATITFRSQTADGMRIHFVNADGSRLRRAPFASAPQKAYGRPTWSPDSHRIAVAEYPATGTKHPLVVHDLGSSESHHVMDDEGLYPGWS